MSYRPEYKFALVTAVCLLCAVCFSADVWVNPGVPGVITSNDCGFVSLVEGQPLVRRYFMSKNEDGLVMFGADRINAGDEIEVPADARLEIKCGNNIIFVLGSQTRMRVMGVRIFPGPDGKQISRLDIILEQGELRAQARFSERREMLFVQSSNANFLLERGDVHIRAGAGWNATNFTGETLARLRRGEVVGAPFELEPGITFANTGRRALSAGEIEELRYSLPLSFEISNAALPPRPALDDSVEAP